MCGIAGFIDNRKISKSNIDELSKKILFSLHHRGPDNKGKLLLEESGITLLHSRLSIIDLNSNANQPMISSSERYVITFNGEIYNFLDLKKELLNEGFSFQTSSDTEVLLATIEFWGLDEALKKINGMFAFCLFDKKLNELTLVRDRFGEKPIYYFYKNNNLIFASELKAIKLHPSFDNSLDTESINLYLKYSYIPSPNSIYKNVKKVGPGSYVKFKIINGKCKKISQVKWYDLNLNLNTFKGTYQEALIDLEELISNSINYQKIADVPIGAFLSGGIDSSLITSLMQANSSERIKTFSVGYTEKSYDESVYAKQIANHLGTEHNELILNENDVIKHIPSMPTIYDEPFADSSQVPTYLISKFAREKVKVCLTGDSGDEIFGGYNRYIYAPKFMKYSKYPIFLRSLFSRLINKTKPSQWDYLFRLMNSIIPNKYKYLSFSEKVFKANQIIEMNDEYQIYNHLISIWNKNSPSLINSENCDSLSRNRFYENGDSFIERMMNTDLKDYLPNDILVKVDRAAMANSLETRIPFLNSEIINFAMSLPMHMKVNPSEGGKKILRDILYKYVPKNMIERPKSGFGIPIDHWLRGSLKEWANDLINKSVIEKQGYLNYALISKEWNQHLSGDFNNHHRIWNILMFQSWLETES